MNKVLYLWRKYDSLGQMHPLISIIVPLYNVAPYLERCLQSLVQQDYQPLEIILIDDGSTDGSGEICDQWATQNPSIKVVHQENQGQAQARNRGTALAQGEWISYVDADDYLATNAMSLLWEAADSSEADLAIGNFYFVSEDGKKCVLAAPLQDKLRSGIEATEDLLYQRNIETSPCGRLYRKSLTEGICFPEGKYYEDLGTVYRYSLKAKRVVYCSEPLYHYVYRSDSSSSQAFQPKKMDAIEMAQSLYQGVCREAPDLEKAAACRLLSMCFHILFQTPEKSSYEKEIFEIITVHRSQVVCDGKARKITRFMALMSYLGVDFLRFIYRLNQTLHCHAGRESYR